MTALDFMKIPVASINELEAALKSKNRENIDAALEKLQVEGDAYFNSVPYLEVEKKVGKEMLKTYMEYIPEGERITIFDVINTRFKGNSDGFVESMFANSIFGSRKNFDKFMKRPNLNQLEKDWMILFKHSVLGGLAKTAMAMQEANKNYDAAHKVWVNGMMNLKLDNGQPIYPDANSTLRLTYGQVLPYKPADGVTYAY